MKRRMRPLLALLLGVLALGCIGILPADAATRATQTITYRGYTITWSAPDGSDVRVVRTPGRADHFPAGVSAASIQRAKSRVATAATLQASQAPVDSCSFVPDSFGLANFQPVCAVHDVCYSTASTTDRLTCDLALLAGLQQACNVYPPGSPLRLTCYGVASIYFIGVRLFGFAFYDGQGNPA
jgi:hypothetical protein